jgi:hypothetical protein
MAAEFKHTAKEAEELLNKIDTFKPSRYPGMSYEEGIQEVLMWLLEDEPKPEV